MDNRQLFAIVGCFVLLFGVFAPLVSIPIIGGVNYFQNGRGDGTIILALAGVSLLAALRRKYGWLWATGLGSLGMLLITFINLQYGMSTMKTSMAKGLEDNPFRGLADLAIQSIQMQWGWAALVAGALMLLMAASMKERSDPELARQGSGGVVTRAPWQRDWLRVTPEAFERMVASFLRQLQGHLHDFSVEHRHSLSGPDGEFELDAVARFGALGAEFVVLVECKHHRSPVRREAVQMLRDKVKSLAAHKGMLFSTGGFQKRAIEYATAQKIALVHYTQGGPIYETKVGDSPTGPCRDYDAYVVSLSEEGGLRYDYGHHERLTQYLFEERPLNR